MTCSTVVVRTWSIIRVEENYWTERSSIFSGKYKGKRKTKATKYGWFLFSYICILRHLKEGKLFAPARRRNRKYNINFSLVASSKPKPRENVCWTWTTYDFVEKSEKCERKDKGHFPAIILFRETIWTSQLLVKCWKRWSGKSLKLISIVFLCVKQD